MDRILIVPAAGRGSRLGAPGPKALVPVAGRPMLDHLLTLHRSTVDRFVVVAAPDALAHFERFIEARSARVDFAVQPEPTGMLDAVVLADTIVRSHRPRRVAVTWCDQIAVSAETVTRLAERALAKDAAGLVFPTARVERPYIHFDRDPTGTIACVRQRREGDTMPDAGESDMGLFDLSLDVYLEDLQTFARQSHPLPATGERNFLPFIPWLAARQAVETVSGTSPIEVVGINTPEDLALVEARLARELSRDR
jgi:bifunctional N-acetylglucosamine-1-phosphate-uridyltransferase/glucosamine-1-phosphate-acetyltransferase GlmU-like protein